jgi:competence protein ComEA
MPDRWPLLPFLGGGLPPGPVTWFGAGLSVAAVCFVGYALALAPPPSVATALPERPEAPPAPATPPPRPAVAAAETPPAATTVAAVAGRVATARAVVDGLAPARPPAATPRPSPTPTPLVVVAGCPGGARINLNTASVADLQALPGVGPAAARRIVDERQQAPFASVDELEQRHLVSRLTFGRLRDLVTVGPDP